MYKDKMICVIVPAFNEEKFIGRVIETMPNCVDKIVVVDDRSTDDTTELVRQYCKKLVNRVVLIQHEKNEGVGGAIVTGYKWARDNEMDITAVMAGDAQMDPEELESIIKPVAEGDVDYSKGNRLFTGKAWKKIPRYRYLGNAVLSLLTKIASGYWHVADSQSGYTAICLDALKTLQLDRLYKKYGFPNHILVMLNVFNYKVKDVTVEPIYNQGAKSGIRLRKVIPILSWLLIKCFFWRLKEKYIIRDFHPLIFFYFFGLTMVPLGLLYLMFIIFSRVFLRDLTTNKMIIEYAMILSTPAALILDTFIINFGLLLLLFAMFFDMEYNKGLK
jgi:glycosyltransferase involved in cell wall biosynthesis